MTKEERIKKYTFYQQEDKEGSQSSYEHFGEKATPILKKVNEITLTQLNEMSNNLISHRI